VEGVVTGVDDEIGASFDSNNSIRRFPEDAGIFVQEEPADADADPGTSEGVFVGFVRDRAAYRPGDVVRVNGRVGEKFGLTMISETINQEPEKVGSAPVPTPVEIDATRAEGQDSASRPYYETLEGMRVRLGVGTANSGGTNKFGELFMTPSAGQDRVFRTDTEPALIATDTDAGAGGPSNPYLDPDGSTTTVEADLFDTVTGATGPMVFAFENYRIMVQEGEEPAVSDTGVPYPYEELEPADRKQFRVVSFNVENYFPVGGQLDGGTVGQEEVD
jgi:predicted extracellular nuclease